MPSNGALGVVFPNTPTLSPTDQSMPTDPSAVGSMSIWVLVTGICPISPVREIDSCPSTSVSLLSAQEAAISAASTISTDAEYVRFITYVLKSLIHLPIG